MINSIILGKKQGSEYLNRKNNILSDVGRRSLLIEPLANVQSNRELTNNSPQNLAKTELDVLENKFKTLLTKYASLTKTVNEDRLNNKLQDPNSDSEERAELVKVNKELMDVANTIYGKIENMQKTIDELKQQKGIHSETIDNHMSNFQGLINRYNELNENEDSLDAIIEDAKIIEESNNINNVLYGISTIILLIVAYRMLH